MMGLYVEGHRIKVKNFVTPCQCKYCTDLSCFSWINYVKPKFKWQNSACMPACFTFHNYLETVCIFKVCYRTTTLSQRCKVHTTAQLHPMQTQAQSQGRPCEICDRGKWKWGKYLSTNLKVFPWQLLIYTNKWPAQSEHLRSKYEVTESYINPTIMNRSDINVTFPYMLVHLSCCFYWS